MELQQIKAKAQKKEDETIKAGQSFNIADYIIGAVSYKAKALQDEALENVKNGDYDNVLRDWTDSELKTPKQRLEAFNRFMNKADFDEWLNIADCVGYIRALDDIIK